jgi:4-diphosphocytidyl-2-C-methyl-D-erythritol kinase
LRLEALAVRCPAKINTVLRVLGPRPDGYHDLDTELVSLELHDLLHLERTSGFHLEVAGEAAGVPVEDNLVMRAARRLQAAVGATALPGARLVLDKRIPVAGGLGGGSSDAAGALEGLVELHGLHPRPGLLAELALGVGSDVPYFLVGGRCRGTSRGEVLTPLPDLPALPVVLANPGFPLSTAAVFAAHRELALAGEVARSPLGEGTRSGLTSRNGRTSLSLRSIGQDGDVLVHGDLWPAALKVEPRLAELERRVRDAVPGGQVGLSGSGPTLFVIPPEGERDATGLAEFATRLRAHCPVVVVTRTLGAAEYRALRFVRRAG